MLMGLKQNQNCFRLCQCFVSVLFHNVRRAQPFDAQWCHMGTAIKHPVPCRVKPSFVIFDIQALWRSGLSIRVPRCQKLQMTA